jgi:serine-type D-Ala-D-Ala carboxypeptidase/endopeptidase (penicillin-binding protein 4)
MLPPGTARLAAALIAAAALLLAPAVADASLRGRLAGRMRPAGSHSGAYVYNATQGKAVFRWRERRARVLASNTKLFTTAAALTRYGPEGTLGTDVLGNGVLGEGGAYDGSLYLRGGGDPTFGSRRFVRANYGGGATVEDLADRIEQAGITSVSGRIYGDETRFDSLRGGPDSGYGTSIWVGPLSALSFNRGLANSRGSAFQTKPPLTAARRLQAALKRRGVKVAHGSRRGRTPLEATVIASVDSPPMERLIRLTNKPSDNFFAEMLLKGLPMAPSSGGSLRRSGTAYPTTPTPDTPDATSAEEPSTTGTTKAGTRVATSYARSLGVTVHLADGSGLSRSDKAAPKQVARLLRALRRRSGFSSFYASLPIAGRDGTLAGRMRSGPAHGRCHAKTGTLSDVSALSGYCVNRSGRTLIFSVLNNRTNIYNARAVQDRVAQALAGSR